MVIVAPQAGRGFGDLLVGRILNLSLLVDPVELGLLVGDELVLVEPEGDLLLGVLDAVGAVADVAADVLLHCECRIHHMCTVHGLTMA